MWQLLHITESYTHDVGAAVIFCCSLAAEDLQPYLVPRCVPLMPSQKAKLSKQVGSDLL